MQEYYFGIEYSKERIKCALAKYDGKKYEVGVLQSFSGDEKSSAIQKFLYWKKEALGDLPAKAVVTISESTIFLKEFTIPSVKKESLDEAIYWELSNASPLSPTQAIYEWMPIFADKKETSLVAMAVRESQIETIVTELEKAQIEVVTIEPSSVSLQRVTSENYAKDTMLLMVGDKQTDILVLKGGSPVFSTTSDVALTRDKEGKWKLSQKVADEIAQSTHELITFREQKGDGKIEQVLITGDLVDKYFGLAKSINKFADVPVNIAKQKNITGFSFEKLPKAFVNRFLIPIGALSRFLGDVYKGPNIIPEAKKSVILKEIVKSAKLSRLKTFTNIFAGYFIALVIVTILYWGFLVLYRVKIDETRNLIATHPGQNHIEYVKSTNNYLEKIDELIRQQKDQGIVLRKISELTPTDIVLTELTFSKDTVDMWKISGTGSREAVLAYYDKLDRESGAEAVTMPYSNLDNDLVNEFEINIIW